ncbi:MAG: 7-carboxy-7-deazaguanine synthase [Sphingomonadaceae bacterium]|uniref:7-carboxy-7-deazaguanine synthase n=1 Tax=Thermaurantiacus sp. TaxID=2820283 RepID=UPI00298F3C4A|nr:7-carboxy-7-deazaguanine synthase [Thermaurantiacus sp.]MCS6987131.1 7-carboxy-7-deazaguanine synthase [Sphingomonadaceae bacterium]MDW8415835.1 7-carboxy-7-deazaguanine synthase [Thermaurantiacus sp.]
MPYAVKEIFLTLQGEGVQAGRRAVFLRFAGCNLWSGRAEDRATSACRFCDTDFVGTDGPGGGRFAQAEALAQAVARCWGPAADHRLVVATGGEPLLQLDPPLVDALHARGFAIAVETNGTRPAPPGLDWITVSPKAGTEVVQRSGDELKVVWPQPLDLEALEAWDFRHFLLQPMDGPERAAHTAEAVRLCLARPRWRLSLQAHKYLGLP